MHWRRKWQPSTVLSWRIPGTGEPEGLPSMGSHRVGYDWHDLAAAAPFSKIIISQFNKFHGHCIVQTALLPKRDFKNFKNLYLFIIQSEYIAWKKQLGRVFFCFVPFSCVPNAYVAVLIIGLVKAKISEFEIYINFVINIYIIKLYALEQMCYIWLEFYRSVVLHSVGESLDLNVLPMILEVFWRF